MSEHNETQDNKFFHWLLIALFGFIVIRNAWMTDDAYVTLRTVENFLAGYGLTYNPFVRVQAFTHPLWALLLSGLYFIQYKLLGLSSPSGLYLLTMCFSIILACLSFGIVLGKVTKGNFEFKLLFAVAAIFSKAFIDYSTSGLENPLTYFLLAVFCYLVLNTKEKLFELALVASLLALNRLDTILLALPALIVVFLEDRRNWKKNILRMLVGFSPLILWEVYSLFYYGMPFPNTAYAKLNTGIGRRLLLGQGLDYLLSSLSIDPLTLFVIVLAGIGIVIRREKWTVALYSGVALYVVYIIWIGGDFMSGKFLAAPFFVSTALLSRSQYFSRQTISVVLTAIIIFGVTAPRTTIDSILSPPSEDFAVYRDANGVDDEKIVYFGRSGLTVNGFRNAKGGSRYAGSAWIYDGNYEVVVEGAIGLFGYQQGPNVYAIDQFALVDPLLARLPVVDKSNWRIGHFIREIPDGYLESLETGQPALHDPALASYYEKLSYVISGPLWSWERITMIWTMNTGQYDHLLDAYVRAATQ